MSYNAIRLFVIKARRSLNIDREAHHRDWIDSMVPPNFDFSSNQPPLLVSIAIPPPPRSSGLLHYDQVDTILKGLSRYASLDKENLVASVEFRLYCFDHKFIAFGYFRDPSGPVQTTAVASA